MRGALNATYANYEKKGEAEIYMKTYDSRVSKFFSSLG